MVSIEIKKNVNVSKGHGKDAPPNVNIWKTL